MPESHRQQSSNAYARLQQVDLLSSQRSASLSHSPILKPVTVLEACAGQPGQVLLVSWPCWVQIVLLTRPRFVQWRACWSCLWDRRCCRCCARCRDHELGSHNLESFGPRSSCCLAHAVYFWVRPLHDNDLLRKVAVSRLESDLPDSARLVREPPVKSTIVTLEGQPEISSTAVGPVIGGSVGRPPLDIDTLSHLCSRASTSCKAGR